MTGVVRPLAWLEGEPGSGRAIAWAGGAFITILLALSSYDIARSHDVTVHEIERELDAQARVIAELTSRSVQTVDGTLRLVADEYRRGRLQGGSADERHAYLRALADGVTQIDGLGMFDAQGDALGVSWLAPRLPPNMASLPRFKALRDDATLGFVIFDAAAGAGDGVWIIPFARRLQTPTGDFAGVVAARGRVDYFQQVYRDTFPDPSTRVALLHRDRATLLARHPVVEAALGREVPRLKELLAGATAERTVARNVSPIDGREQFGTLRAVAGYPLVVAVTRDAQAALQPWRQLALRGALRTLGLAALASGLLWLAVRHFARSNAARQSLAISEERYALAAAGADDGIWDWDVAAGTAYESQRARELQGLPPAPESQPLAAVVALLRVHPDDRARRDRALQDHLEGRTPAYEVEYRACQADDQYRWVRVRGLCTRDASGRPLRIAGSVSDITERKQAEARRERLEQQLRQAQKLEAIGTLAGGIAHDFNNILSAILGYGELAAKGAVPGSAQQRHLDAALAAGQRAKSLVERILAFSRSGMGERVPVHVMSVVAEAVQAMAATVPPGVELVHHLETGDAAVLGDPTQIHQVVMNLCANAVQAMGSTGRLSVGLDRHALQAPLAVATTTLAPGSYLRLVVADTGVGIEARLLERIFDPFFTTKEVGVGTGLGLSLVHGIVADLGGGIDVDSRLGVGSRFTIYLPWADVAAAAPSAVPVPGALQGAGQVVLVVDDEEPLVRLCEELLAGLGYEPVGFVSGPAALQALRSDPARFDLLLSDASMPGLTGMELAVQARRLRPDLPVLLMTGFVGPALQQQAAAVGVLEVLAKPLAAAEIARALAAALLPPPSSTTMHPTAPTP